VVLLLCLALQADSDVGALVRALADDRIDARAAAEARLWELPARLLPRVLQEAAAHDEHEIRAVAGRMRVAPAWSAFLPGSIREARGLVARIEEGGHPDRAKAAARALALLVELPPERARDLAAALLSDPSPHARLFALEALRRFPPSDPAPLIPFLKDPPTSSLAAEVLVAMDASSVVPLAVDLFCEEGGATLAAARVLEAFGAGEQAPRIAAAVQERIGLIVWGIRILRATGPSAEPLLIDLAPQVSAPRQLEIAEALSRMGTARSLPLLRDLLRERPEVERDPLLWAAGDREWALRSFEEIRRKPDLENLARLRGLAEFVGPSEAGGLRDWVRDERELRVRAEAVILLGAAGWTEDLPLLRTLAERPELREAAEEAIDRVGSPPRPLPKLRDESKLPTIRLLEGLRVFDGGVRRNAVGALAVRKSADAIPVLVRLVNDPSKADADGLRVWHYAMAALERLTGTRTEGASTAEQRAFWRRQVSVK
jgi:HEAT repeat protein